VRGWRTIYHAKGHQKKAGVAIFISDKIDFNPKMVIKMSIHQEDVTIINMYAPNNKYQNILIKYRT